MLYPIRCYTAATTTITGLPDGQTSGGGALEVKANYNTGETGIQNLIMTWTKVGAGRTWQCTQDCSDGSAPAASKWTDWKEITPS